MQWANHLKLLRIFIGIYDSKINIVIYGEDKSVYCASESERIEFSSNWKGNGMKIKKIEEEEKKKQNAHIRRYLGIINPFWKIRGVEIFSGHDIVCNVQFLFNVN